MVETTGLGNRALLDKVDRLRELGISDKVPLPEMVVVGDQSAGKSSVLESLTGFHFPRAVNLCTRHATEIICRREPNESVTISIDPHDKNTERARHLGAFRKVVTRLNSNDFAKIFAEAAEVMGIKSSLNSQGPGSAFSQDILRVEISGPKADHLTVIDVPGMFETATPGVTTDSDIDLVKNMVKRYIKRSRTIILAVVPCTGDIANQKILRLAAEADPEGKRTLGVLTKPDLAVENATKGVVCDLVNGKRRDLHLGYCVVKNRGADDENGSMASRDVEEQTLFSQEPWCSLPRDRLGVPALRVRIQSLLMDRTRAEFPNVRNEIASRLKMSREMLESMGEARSTTDQQRAFVGRIASRFTQLKNYGLDAYYTRDPVFEDLELRLITRIRSINEAYADIMIKRGHTREFEERRALCIVKRDISVLKDSVKALDSASPDRDELYGGELDFSIPTFEENELYNILAEPYYCSEPEKGEMLSHIQKEYVQSRGYELGTFSSELLPGTFKQQAMKWNGITRAHVSNTILIVHQFINSLLEECCPDEAVRQELWVFLQEKLQDGYKRAMAHTEFLLSVEFASRSMTFDPDFTKMLSELRTVDDRDIPVEVAEAGKNMGLGGITSLLNKLLKDDASPEKTSQKIHDVLFTYYKIARTRFIDVVCQQVIYHYLLTAKDGPLSALSHDAVLEMTPDQLDLIAGEDMGSRGKRETLTKEIESLTRALKILRA